MKISWEVMLKESVFNEEASEVRNNQAQKISTNNIRFKSNFTAWIFSIGNEVVQGRVVNTNATYLGRKLTLLGYNVISVISIPDNRDIISYFFKLALENKPSLIISTGGLGPTYDDITSEVLASVLNVEWVINNEALKAIKEKYAERDMVLTKERIKMAKMPKGAKPIYNPVGTAPGILYKHNSTLIIALPGVPKEMIEMFERYVEPMLREKGPRISILEEVFTVKHLPESSAAQVISKVMKKYVNVYIKSHPKGHEVKAPLLDIYVMVSSKNENEAKEILHKVVNELKEELIKLGGSIKTD